MWICDVTCARRRNQIITERVSPFGDSPPPPTPALHTRATQRSTSSSATCWLAVGDIIADRRKTGPLEGMTSVFIQMRWSREREGERFAKGRGDVLILLPKWVLAHLQSKTRGRPPAQGKAAEVHSQHRHTLSRVSARRKREGGGLRQSLEYCIVTHVCNIAPQRLLTYKCTHFNPYSFNAITLTSYNEWEVCCSDFRN